MRPGARQVITGAAQETGASAGDDRLRPIYSLRGRNITKADILVCRLEGGDVAVKDYAPRPWWIRHTLGRWLISRETRAYRAAGSLPGLLEFLGRTGPYSLSTRFVDAHPLFTETPVAMSCFDRLDRIVAGLHERGVAIGDLHRRNVLVDRRGTVYIVDLATAWVAGPGAGPLRRWVLSRFSDADRVALARLRARAMGRDPAAAVEAIGGAAARWDRRGRMLRRVRDRLRRKRPGGS